MWYCGWVLGAWFCIVGWDTKTVWYEWFGVVESDWAGKNIMGSETAIGFSGFGIESVTELAGIDGKELDAVEAFTRPAFFASSAANVERTECIIIWEEVEAVSLSATSAAMAAAVLFGVCGPFAFISVDEVVVVDSCDT